MPKIFKWSEFLRRFRCPGDDGDVRAYRATGDGVTDAHNAIQKVLGVGAAALLLLGGALAQADESGTYRFTTVLDSQRDGLEATRCPPSIRSGRWRSLSEITRTDSPRS